MRFKFNFDVKRQYLYSVTDINVFKNKIISKIKDKEMNTFFDFCDFYEIDPINFTIDNKSYILTNDDMHINIVDIESRGIHWKHKVNENVLNSDHVYNFKIAGKYMYYTCINDDFLKDYLSDEIDCYEYTFKLDRKTEFLFIDYLSLYAKDYTVTKTTDGLLLQCKNGKALTMYKDFEFFLERNKVECPKCNTLVDNAFDDYMVQFYTHDGC